MMNKLESRYKARASVGGISAAELWKKAPNIPQLKKRGIRRVENRTEPLNLPVVAAIVV